MLVGQRISQIPPYGLQNYVAGILASLERICRDRHGLFTLSTCSRTSQRNLGPSPISRAAPGIHAELWIVGAAVALLLAGLILSPPGRASGGHTNPAISLAM